MRRLWGILLAALLSGGAHAQTTARVGYAADGNGSQPFTYVSSLTPLPVSGSFSAGSFAPGGNYATLTSTASSADAALPTGTTVALFNTGTTAVSCILSIGAGTATASKNVIQSNSWFAVVPGSNTHYSCINQAGDSASNVVVASGGSGLPAGAGGGGGGTSGTITNWGSGSNTLGAMANYGTSPGAVLVPGVNAFVTNASTDPCSGGTNKITAAISQAASGTIITGTSAKKTYICGGSFNISDAESVSITEGTGSTCGTGTPFALVGSTTVANGMALAANEGVSLGTGIATNVYATNTAADNVCLLQSGTGRAAGWVTYVQQ